MALNIKNAHAERLARELARERGETLTDAMIAALEAELGRIRESRRRAAPDPDLERILTTYRRLPVLDGRTPSEIEADLYDDDGLPR